MQKLSYCSQQEGATGDWRLQVVPPRVKKLVSLPPTLVSRWLGGCIWGYQALPACPKTLSQTDAGRCQGHVWELPAGDLQGEQAGRGDMIGTHSV